jgi:hypothetical protein
VPLVKLCGVASGLEILSVFPIWLKRVSVGYEVYASSEFWARRRSRWFRGLD